MMKLRRALALVLILCLGVQPLAAGAEAAKPNVALAVAPVEGDLYKLTASVDWTTGVKLLNVALSYDNTKVVPVDAKSHSELTVADRAQTLACFQNLQTEHDTRAAQWRVQEGRTVFAYAAGASGRPEKSGEVPVFEFWFQLKPGVTVDADTLRLEREGELYCQCRGEAWLNIHGSWDNYDGEAFYQDALVQWRRDRRSVVCAMLGDEMAGLIQMDLERDGDKGVGYIPFVYMMPLHRKQGLGVQLIGQAVSTYRPMGRKYLRLRCAPDNLVAQRFCRRYGFRKVAEAEGTRVPLDIMEKYIGY